MVLNHSSTPIDLEQVEKPEQTFYENATQTEVKFNKDTISNLKKKLICVSTPRKWRNGRVFLQALQIRHTDICLKHYELIHLNKMYHVGYLHLTL